MDNRKEFGEIMRTAREAKGLTQQKLAEIVGISEVYCWNVECGEYTPTWVIWLKICTALDIDVNKAAEIVLTEVEAK